MPEGIGPELARGRFFGRFGFLCWPPTSQAVANDRQSINDHFDAENAVLNLSSQCHPIRLGRRNRFQGAERRFSNVTVAVLRHGSQC